MSIQTVSSYSKNTESSKWQKVMKHFSRILTRIIFVFTVFCDSKQEAVHFFIRMHEFICKNRVNKACISILSSLPANKFKIQGFWFYSNFFVIRFPLSFQKKLWWGEQKGAQTVSSYLKNKELSKWQKVIAMLLLYQQKRRLVWLIFSVKTGFFHLENMKWQQLSRV